MPPNTTSATNAARDVDTASATTAARDVDTASATTAQPAAGPLTATIHAPRTGPSRSSVTREHRYDIDLIRLICSCTVMLGHVGAQFIAAVDRQEANGPGSYWTGHLAEAVNAFAVPMYFAMAGWAVLVGAPPRDGRRMWRRIMRYTVPLFVWTAVYIAWGRLRGTNEDPVSSLALDSLFGSVRPAYHLWYLYAYIPIVALLAFAMLVRQGQRPWGLGAALLGLATGPVVMENIGTTTGWDMPEFGWGFGVYGLVYAVGGALLFALPTRVPARRRWLLVGVMLLSMAGCLWYDTQVKYVIPNAHIFVATMTICVLLLLNRIPVPQRLRRRLPRLADAALGAYLVHVLVITELVHPVVSADLSGPVAGLLLVGLLLITIVVSFAASLLWGRLKLRRWLG